MKLKQTKSGREVVISKESGHLSLSLLKDPFFGCFRGFHYIFWVFSN